MSNQEEKNDVQKKDKGLDSKSQKKEKSPLEEVKSLLDNLPHSDKNDSGSDKVKLPARPRQEGQSKAAYFGGILNKVDSLVPFKKGPQVQKKDGQVFGVNEFGKLVHGNTNPFNQLKETDSQHNQLDLGDDNSHSPLINQEIPISQMKQFSQPSNKVEISAFDPLHSNSAGWGLTPASLAVDTSVYSVGKPKPKEIESDFDPLKFFTAVVLTKRCNALLEHLIHNDPASNLANYSFIQFTQNSEKEDLFEDDAAQCLTSYGDQSDEDYSLQDAGWGCQNLENKYAFEKIVDFDLKATIAAANLQSEVIEQSFPDQYNCFDMLMKYKTLFALNEAMTSLLSRIHWNNQNLRRKERMHEDLVETCLKTLTKSTTDYSFKLLGLVQLNSQIAPLPVIDTRVFCIVSGDYGQGLSAYDEQEDRSYQERKFQDHFQNLQQAQLKEQMASEKEASKIEDLEIGDGPPQYKDDIFKNSPQVQKSKQKKNQNKPLSIQYMPKFNQENEEESESIQYTEKSFNSEYVKNREILLAEIQKRGEKNRLPGFTYYSAEEKLNKFDNTFGKCHFCWYTAKKNPMVMHVASQHHTHWQDTNDISEYMEILDALKDDPPKYFQNMQKLFQPGSKEFLWMQANTFVEDPSGTLTENHNNQSRHQVITMQMNNANKNRTSKRVNTVNKYKDLLLGKGPPKQKRQKETPPKATQQLIAEFSRKAGERSSQSEDDGFPSCNWLQYRVQKGKTTLKELQKLAAALHTYESNGVEFSESMQKHYLLQLVELFPANCAIFVSALDANKGRKTVKFPTPTKAYLLKMYKIVAETHESLSEKVKLDLLFFGFMLEGDFLKHTQQFFVRTPAYKNTETGYQSLNYLCHQAGVPQIACEAIFERWGKPGFDGTIKELLNFYLSSKQSKYSDKDLYLAISASSYCSDLHMNQDSLFLSFANCQLNKSNLNAFFLKVLSFQQNAPQDMTVNDMYAFICSASGRQYGNMDDLAAQILSSPRNNWTNIMKTASSSAPKANISFDDAIDFFVDQEKEQETIRVDIQKLRKLLAVVLKEIDKQDALNNQQQALICYLMYKYNNDKAMVFLCRIPTGSGKSRILFYDGRMIQEYVYETFGDIVDIVAVYSNDRLKKRDETLYMQLLQLCPRFYKNWQFHNLEKQSILALVYSLVKQQQKNQEKKFVLMLDECDQWGQWDYADLVRGLCVAQQNNITVICLSGTTLTTGYLKENQLWDEVIQCKLIDYNADLEKDVEAMNFVVIGVEESERAKKLITYAKSQVVLVYPGEGDENTLVTAWMKSTGKSKEKLLEEGFFGHLKDLTDEELTQLHTYSHVVNEVKQYTIWFACDLSIRGFDTLSITVPMVIVSLKSFYNRNDMIQAGGRVARQGTTGTREFWQTSEQVKQKRQLVDPAPRDQLMKDIAVMLHMWGYSQRAKVGDKRTRTISLEAFKVELLDYEKDRKLKLPKAPKAGSKSSSPEMRKSAKKSSSQLQIDQKVVKQDVQDAHALVKSQSDVEMKDVNKQGGKQDVAKLEMPVAPAAPVVAPQAEENKPQVEAPAEKEKDDKKKV